MVFIDYRLSGCLKHMRYQRLASLIRQLSLWYEKFIEDVQKWKRTVAAVIICSGKFGVFFLNVYIKLFSTLPIVNAYFMFFQPRLFSVLAQLQNI